MNTHYQIDIGEDFSDTPMGRYFPKDGDHCGQKFREEHLVPALNEHEKVSVVIDNVEGYGSSFLEEAFGGLVRKEGFTAENLAKKLAIEWSDPDFEVYKTLIWKHINDAVKS